MVAAQRRRGGGNTNNRHKPNNPKNKHKPKEAPPEDNGAASDLLMDTGKNLASDLENRQAYFNKMLTAGGMAPGESTPFGEWLETRAFDYMQDMYKNAMLDNNDLTFEQFATQRYGNVADGTLRSSQVPLGVGQPIDTGNPFTSSSGIAASPTPPTPAAPAAPKPPAMPTFQEWQQQQGINKPKGGFNDRRRKRLQAQYNAFSPTATPPGASPTPPNTGDDLIEWRKRFLSLAPEVRGESVAGIVNTPARWSAWG